MQEKISFSPESHLGQTLHQWWVDLKDDRASRAMLRRCSTLDEVSLSPAYGRFYRFMLAHRWPAESTSTQKDKLAAIASLLAHVITDDQDAVAVRMSVLAGDKPLVSELRFRGLLKIDDMDVDDLFVSLRRTLPLIKNQVNVYQLAHDIYWWDDITKKRWAYDYRWPVKQNA
ncbi:type I-E CRISPR-associated protein Cse2/CasB [Undibacterium sp. MH2W]|uniref:type I-E CRISPR-associated protein Cse2/CasB n=1 Tax=Undibacterium sp. MH2W TaxID=3413044 RepID=UPI003BF4186B